jgi:hypothetical protein
MEARSEFSVRLTAKSATTTVIVGGLLALGSPEPPHAPLHADTHQPFIGLSPNLGIDGATSIHPDIVAEIGQAPASGAPGAGQHFKLGQHQFSGVSLPPDSPTLG